jgi:hypothetical protein
MTKRFITLAACLFLLVGIAGAADSRPVSPRASDGPFGRIIRGERLHGITPPAPEPIPSKQAEGIRVLIVAADDASYLASLLMAYPDIASVAYINGSTVTPNLTQLLDYDVVIAYCNYPYLDNVALGNVLADYVDAGGRLILTAFNWFTGGGYPWYIAGRILDPGYSPFLAAGGSHYSYANLAPDQPGHPLLQGVSSLSAYYRDIVTLAPGAELVASWSDGDEAVAVNGCVVGINMYYGSAWSGDGAVLIHNAILFLMGGCSAYRDYVFVDDWGRSKLCLNADGTFLYQVLTGDGAGEYEGTAQMYVRAGVLFATSPRDSAWTFYLIFDSTTNRANGFFWHPAAGVRSYIYDHNTLDDPDTCF